MIWVLFCYIAFALKVDETRSVTKIAFGSCANQFKNKNPALFNSIADWNPDLFIWGGDTIYPDIMIYPGKSRPNTLPIWKKQYLDLKAELGYKELLEKTMVTGIWDDHDYGTNDGNNLFPLKEESKKLFLEFIDDGSIRDHPGIYHSFTFPDLKIILLDNRWFRDPKQNKTGDTLGEQQWEWLETEIYSNSTIKILVSGIQIYTHDRTGPAELWHDKSRERLMKIIDKVPGVILLSGDVHYAEIMRIYCRAKIFYEFTSSGLTHTVRSVYGFIGAFFVKYLSPYTYNIGPKIIEKNFGTLEFDWKKGWVQFAIRDTSGKILNSHKTSISELYMENIPADHCEADIQSSHILQLKSAFLVFLLPFLLNSLAFLIYLRKKSNSY